jgi:arabinogalactan oligomer / maltooligosaccharide transport system substrate-binding protein
VLKILPYLEQGEKIMKRTLFVLISILMVGSILLTACGTTATQAVSPTKVPATAVPPTEVPPTAEPAPVTITIWHQWSGDYLTAITAVFQQYMTDHPNVTIDLSKPDDVTASLKVAIPAGEGPDIIGWANDQIGANALNGNIVALSDYGIDTAFLTSTYEPAAVAGVQWNGKIWALPESQESMTLVYNKALVTAADLPTENTMAAWLAAIKAYYEKNSIPLLCNQGFGASDAYQVAPIYFGEGVPAYVDETGKAYMDTPEALAGAQWFLDAKPYLLQEMSYDICNTGMAEGKVAGWLVGPWAIAGLETAKVDYGFAPFGKPFVGIKTLMLTQNAVDRGNTDIALDIMKYFTSAAPQKAMTLANKTVPANTAALTDPEVQALATIAGFGAAAAGGVPMSASPYANAQWGPVGDAQAAIWNGSQTPADALAAAQAAIDAAVAALK